MTSQLLENDLDELDDEDDFPNPRQLEYDSLTRPNTGSAPVPAVQPSGPKTLHGKKTQPSNVLPRQPVLPPVPSLPNYYQSP